MWIFFLFRIRVTSEKNFSKVHIRWGLTSKSPASRGVTCFLIPVLRRQVVGSSRFHWIGPFSLVWTPEMQILIENWKYVSNLFKSLENEILDLIIETQERRVRGVREYDPGKLKKTISFNKNTIKVNTKQWTLLTILSKNLRFKDLQIVTLFIQRFSIWGTRAPQGVHKMSNLQTFFH